MDVDMLTLNSDGVGKAIELKQRQTHQHQPRAIEIRRREILRGRMIVFSLSVSGD